jgi:UTP--glucose-1-phosphate uridylyltransferase
LIQYAVEEALRAGIRDLIFVTSSAKRAIEDHFDLNFELEYKLKEKEKWDLLKDVQNIPPRGVNCIYVRQQEALGLGHAVLCAKDLIDDEPFAILLADDLIAGPGLDEMVQVMESRHAAGVLAVQEVPKSEVSHYGIVSTDASGRIEKMVEKPVVADAPSNLAVVGRYILPPQVFAALEQTQKGRGGEIQLTDGIAKLLQHYPILAHRFSGTRYDCGDKLGYLKANLHLGLQHAECGEEWRKYLKQLEI